MPDLKIILIPSSFAPKVGGLETAMRYLSAELVSRGHEVTVITNRYPRSLKPFEVIDGIPVHRLLFPDFAPSRTQIKRLGKFLGGLALAPIQLARLAHLIRSFKPDLVNAHYLGVTGVYACAVSAVDSLPFVLSVHGSDLTSVPFPSGNEKIAHWVMKKANGLTACSQELARCASSMLKSGANCNVIVTGNGVEAKELNNGENYVHSRPYLFAASHFTPIKGVETFIRAFAELVDAGYDIDAIVAGDGPCSDSYKLLVNELALNSRVHFWGVATRRDMAALLRGCALFVMPSLKEAFGITNLEAMVCGKAVVASRVGGIPEVVKDRETGLLVPPGDSIGLAGAIRELLDEADKREAMGQRGREIAMSQFTWSAVTDRYLEAYKRAMESWDEIKIAI